MDSLADDVTIERVLHNAAIYLFRGSLVQALLIDRFGGF